MSITHVAASAISRQIARFERSATRVARVSESSPPPDLARETAVRSETETAVKANASVIEADDECTKSLLDILA